MYKHLLTRLLVLVLFSSCASSSQQPVRSTGTQYAENLLLSDSLPQPMMEQPRTEEGAFALEPGFYEADFKSYCLQPGTPDPSRNDAYFQSSLTGPRSEILHSILRQSKERPHLDQQNVQLLLWAVVSRTPYHKLSPWVQETGRQLLTQKQVFELNGGVMGMVKTVAAMVPSGGSSDIQKLFELGSNTYEAYERMAVLRTASTVHRPAFKLHQWYRHPEGYYVRYYPDGYKKTKIQVYVPEGAVGSEEGSGYIRFDPYSTVISSANSNAQRLGIGAPVIEVAKSVIRIIGSGKKKEPKKSSPPKPPVKGT